MVVVLEVPAKQTQVVKRREEKQSRCRDDAEYSGNDEVKNGIWIVFFCFHVIVRLTFEVGDCDVQGLVVSPHKAR